MTTQRWLECPACHGVFAFIRDDVEIWPFMPIESKDYEDWDGEPAERHSVARCIDCGRSVIEIQIYCGSPQSTPFRSAQVRKGNPPNPRAMLVMIGHRGDEKINHWLLELLSEGSYCTRDDERKLIVPRIAQLSGEKHYEKKDDRPKNVVEFGRFRHPHDMDASSTHSDDDSLGEKQT